MALEERFEIEPPIHVGQIATAYPATQRGLGRRVLLKVIHPQWANDAELSERFQREGRAVAKVDHPNVVRVYEFGLEEAVPYLAMEWIEGGTLKERIRQGPLGQGEVADIARDILQGLNAVHAQGLLHRDLKPDNILIGRDGRARLADFSLAGFAGQAGLTSHGSLVGSPAYLAPELLEGAAAAVASDLYGAGVVLYEALTGSNPYAASDVMVSLDRVRKLPLKRLSERGSVDRKLAGLIDALLERNPAHRPPGAAAALSLLDGKTPKPAARSSGKGFKAVAAGLIGAAVIAALLLWRLTSAPPPPVVPVQAPEEALGGGEVAGGDAVAESGDTAHSAPAPITPPPEAAAPPVTEPAPAEASLTLVVSPWAEVFVDGVPLGLTPLGTLKMTPQRHRLRLRHEYLPAVEREIELQAGAHDTLYFDLRASAAKLHLSAAPWGYLWVNGDSLGLLPRPEPVYLPAGSYLIEVRHPELSSWRDTIRLAAGGSFSGRIDLTDGTVIAE